MMKLFVASGLVLSGHALMSASDHDAVRQAEVDAINAIKGITWHAEIAERFRGQPSGASKSLLGVKEGQLERIKAAIAKGDIVREDAPSDFVAPDSFDSETNWPKCAKVINDIRDQSNCGCCWAFGGASAASDRLCIATDGKLAVPISAEDVCFGGSFDGCGGGFLEDTWSYIQSGAVSGGQQDNTGPLGGGFCSKFSLPHCHHHGPQGKDPYPAEGAPGCPSEDSPSAPKKCDSDASSGHSDFAKDKYSFSGKITSYPNEKAIQSAIMTSGPIETAFSVYKDFENYAGGVYKPTSKEILGGHAVRIVGWGVDSGTKYWKVANSWNPYWGEEGYFRIVRGQDACGIESQGLASSADAKWSGPGL